MTGGRGHHLKGSIAALALALSITVKAMAFKINMLRGLVIDCHPSYLQTHLMNTSGTVQRGATSLSIKDPQVS